MSEATDVKRKVPSFVVYLAILTVILLLITSLTMLLDSLTAGTVQQNNLVTGAGVLIFGSAVTFVEIFFMRRSFKRFGFLLGLGGEALKIGTTLLYVSEVGTDLFIGLYSATFASILISKYFRERIDKLATTGFSRNALQVLPSLIIILLFVGGSIFSSLGFGASSTSPNPQDFDTSDIDFSLFKVPDWNANYFLDNILDQFLGGLLDPTQIIFNVTNLTPGKNAGPDFGLTSAQQNPLTYYKDQTYDQYAYDSLKATTGTFFTSNTEVNVLTELDALGQDYSSINSKDIPNSVSETLTLELSVPIQHSDSFRAPVPVIANGRTYGLSGENSDYGSYINPGDVSVDGQSCNDPSLTCNYIENSLPFSNFNDFANVELNIDGFSQSSSDSILKYEMEYLLPDYKYVSAYSGNVSSYEQIFSPATWNAIKQIYLQLPNNNDGTLRPGYATYQDWAPFTYSIAEKYNDSSASIFQRAYTMTKVLNRSLGLRFDTDLWLGELTGQLQAGIDYPDPNGELDYIEWFLTGKKGVSAHFASALTVLLRLQGIPSRFVTGYALGNTTIDPSKTVVTSVYKHAWTEVLVPLNTPNGLSYQWIIMDPLFLLLPSETEYLIMDPYAYDNSIIFDLSDPNFSQNLLESIKRVGVDQNDSNNFDYKYDNVNDNGIIRSNVFEPSSLFSTVHVGVQVNSFTFALGTQDFFMVGVGDVNLNLQAINNQTKQIKNWIENTTSPNPVTNINLSVTTNPDGFVERNFTYNPVEHGTGGISFAVIMEDPILGLQTIDDCRGANNEPTCVAAYSDSNRATSAVPLAGFDYLTGTSFSSVTDLLNAVHVDYATHTLQISTEPYLLKQNKIISNNYKIDTSIEETPSFTLNLNSIFKNIYLNFDLSQYYKINLPDSSLMLISTVTNTYNFFLLFLIPSIIGVGILFYKETKSHNFFLKKINI